MSMISAQCDKLREMADQLQEHGTFVGFGGTANTDPLMHGAAIVMREAADTIWELRDDLQRANDAVQDAEHDESIAWDRVRKAEAENAKLRNDLEDANNQAEEVCIENAKLRELCKELLDLCYDAYNQEWGWDDDWALAYERAKKLGVDDGD